MKPALTVSHLHKSYGATTAVRDLSFTIEPGEIFGLLGPNGAGKSTTINMISGVTRLGGGRVEVFGHDNQRQYRLTRRLVGVMHQEIVIDHFLTIDRSLDIHPGYYGCPSDPRWKQELIERLGLGPHLHKSMNKLSGGLKRRLMVAKALVHRPPLLILDEPTAGVDVELRHTLWEFVAEINRQGTTVLLTTHYLEEAEKMCGRIAIMNHGALVALDSKEELLRQLGGKRLTLELAEPLTRIPEELAPFAPQLLQNGQRLVLTWDGGVDRGDPLGTLYRLGISVTDLDTEKSGLEEVFLQLTGVANGRGGRP